MGQCIGNLVALRIHWIRKPNHSTAVTSATVARYSRVLRVVRRVLGPPTNQGVGGSKPSGRANLRGSLPTTSVTDYSLTHAPESTSSNNSYPLLWRFSSLIWRLFTVSNLFHRSRFAIRSSPAFAQQEASPSGPVMGAESAWRNRHYHRSAHNRGIGGQSRGTGFAATAFTTRRLGRAHDSAAEFPGSVSKKCADVLQQRTCTNRVAARVSPLAPKTEQDRF